MRWTPVLECRERDLKTESESMHADTEILGIYNASKGAIHIFDETLRLELAPMGIKVVTVVTGAVDTEICRNSPEPVLPPTSKYHAAQERLKLLATSEDGHKATKAAEYADAVVSDILGGATGKIWRGAHSTTTRYLSTLLPTSTMVSRSF